MAALAGDPGRHVGVVAGDGHYTAAKGITWSATIAADYYKKGCDKHSAMSCANTAELYRYGIAIPRDPAAAAKLYKQVCDDGSGVGFRTIASIVA